MIEHASAPTISDAIGANRDSTSEARISAGSSASDRRVCRIVEISMSVRVLPAAP
jgi:hypothetical protein